MNHNNQSLHVHPEQQSLCDHCLSNPHYLIVPKTAVSRLVALLLLISFFIFVTGYFLGKKKLAEDFSRRAENTSFSDQINFALTTLYDKELHVQKMKEDDNDMLHSIEHVEESQPERSLHAELPPLVEQKPASQKKWAAHLLGGTQKDVTEFANRLGKQGIAVAVKKRFGRTARGNKIHWYQAVTQPYENESELQTLVARIKKLENIKISSDTIVQLST
jgi:hypothetical protein